MKLPYYKALAGAVNANIQAGRGGACTTYYSAFDPEAEVLTMAQNPRTPTDKQNRDLHFAMMSNRFMGKKVMSNESFFTFNTHTAPDLMKAFYSGDQDEFERIYNKYEADPAFKKNYVNARDYIGKALVQGFEVGTNYLAFIDEINRHTPYKEPIYSSNLCLEITQPTSPYFDMQDLYSATDHGRGEVSLCSLAGIVECNIENDSQYESATYYALKMIDYCIHQSEYPLPHVGFTAKQRLNAGIGILGVATTMARANLKYDTKEGLQKIHDIKERHAYYCISASLRLGKERGNAPWIHKTKWPEGWLPIDTYKRTVDELVPPVYKYDWETLRSKIVANKGIRNSSVMADMPTESSSKASGIPNSLYPIRDLSIKKSDGSNVVDWCAVDGDILGDKYQPAWAIDSVDMIKVYAVAQKWTDQAISADLWKDRSTDINLSKKVLINEYLTMIKYGMKTRYYQNSLTGSQSSASIAKYEETPLVTEVVVKERGCSGGVCDI
jgi:ribonucleoside-diphosphate reductase alpha chain